MPKRAVEYVPWRRMDAERPAQREGIPGVVSRDDLEEVYEGMGTIPSRAARRDMVRSMESLDLRTCMRLRQTSALSNFDVDELPHLTILFGPADVLRLSVSTCLGGDDDERLTEAHGHARRGAPIRVSRLMISPPGRSTTHPSQNGSFVLLAMILVSRSPNSRDCAVTRLNPQPISSHLILCFSPSPLGIHAAQALYGLSVGPCTGITSATDRPTDSEDSCGRLGGVDRRHYCDPAGPTTGHEADAGCLEVVADAAGGGRAIRRAKVEADADGRTPTRGSCRHWWRAVERPSWGL